MRSVGSQLHRTTYWTRDEPPLLADTELEMTSSPDGAGPTVVIKGGDGEAGKAMMLSGGDEVVAEQDAVHVGGAGKKGGAAGAEMGMLMENDLAVNGKLHHASEYSSGGGGGGGGGGGVSSLRRE